LRFRDRYIEGTRRNALGARLHLQEQIADLRTIAMNDHDSKSGRDDLRDAMGGLFGTRSLPFGCCGFTRAQERIASQRDNRNFLKTHAASS